MSLSRRSPTMTLSSAMHPASSKAFSKIFLSGLAYPSSADAAITSKYWRKPQDARRSAVPSFWFAIMPSLYPLSRSAANVLCASGYGTSSSECHGVLLRPKRFMAAELPSSPCLARAIRTSSNSSKEIFVPTIMSRTRWLYASVSSISVEPISKKIHLIIIFRLRVYLKNSLRLHHGVFSAISASKNLDLGPLNLRFPSLN